MHLQMRNAIKEKFKRWKTARMLKTSLKVTCITIVCKLLGVVPSLNLKLNGDGICRQRVTSQTKALESLTQGYT